MYKTEKRRTQAAYDLLPDDIRGQIPTLYATETDPDPVVWVKWFTPDSSWTWHVTEFDGQDVCFGLVDGFEAELGSFSLAEIRELRGPLGLPVERDIHWQPIPLSRVQAEISRRRYSPDAPVDDESGKGR